MFWYDSSEVISRTFTPQCCDCMLNPLYLINMLEKTKHTWFPTQKNTSKTYITDSRNVLPSCARGKVNRFYHSHKNLSLSLLPFLSIWKCPLLSLPTSPLSQKRKERERERLITSTCSRQYTHERNALRDDVI